MRLRCLAVAGSAVSLLASAASAQTATQVVRFQVNAVSQIAVAGTTAPLVINSATAGGVPTSVSAGGSTYAITTNELNQKITASLDQALPSGVTLEVALTAPSGAASTGHVSLSTAGADVVTGISSTSAAALPISYRLSATPAVHMSASAARTVTFTIVSGT
jgi:hypothetical protein